MSKKKPSCITSSLKYIMLKHVHFFKNILLFSILFPCFAGLIPVVGVNYDEAIHKVYSRKKQQLMRQWDFFFQRHSSGKTFQS